MFLKPAVPGGIEENREEADGYESSIYAVGNNILAAPSGSWDLCVGMSCRELALEFVVLFGRHDCSH